MNKIKIKKELRRIIKQYPNGDIPVKEFEIIECIQNIGLLQNSKSFIDGSYSVHYSEKDLNYIKTNFWKKVLEVIKFFK